jgi:hypothetical protein
MGLCTPGDISILRRQHISPQRSNLDQDCFLAFGSSQIAFRPALSEGAARHRRRQSDSRARWLATALLAVPRPHRRHEIDRRTGKIWAKKFTVAHDCRLIITPTAPPLYQYAKGATSQACSN